MSQWKATELNLPTAKTLKPFSAYNFKARLPRCVCLYYFKKCNKIWSITTFYLIFYEFTAYSYMFRLFKIIFRLNLGGCIYEFPQIRTAQKTQQLCLYHITYILKILCYYITLCFITFHIFKNFLL